MGEVIWVEMNKLPPLREFFDVRSCVKRAWPYEFTACRGASLPSSLLQLLKGCIFSRTRTALSRAKKLIRSFGRLLQFASHFGSYWPTSTSRGVQCFVSK